MRKFDGKVALVTGGGRGIGRASALAFAREGAKVAVADVLAEEAGETVKMIYEIKGEAIFIKTDVSLSADVKHLVDQVIATYGRLDCAHNNAGVLGTSCRMTEYEEAVWDRVMNVNLKGVWLCMKYEIPQMVKYGGGAIVNTASTFGLVGSPNRTAYVASKHGIVGLTRAAALEFAKDHIRVNAVCPGVIRTPIIDQAIADDPQREKWLLERHPIGRMGTPADIAEAVVWLCSDASSFVTGLAMTVDGGYTAQ